MHTTQTITKHAWTLLPYPPYSPNLTSLDYNMPGPFKKKKKKQVSEGTITTMMRH
jgi:hypothetical protein